MQIDCDPTLPPETIVFKDYAETVELLYLFSSTVYRVSCRILYCYKPFLYRAVESFVPVSLTAFAYKGNISLPSL